MRERPRLMHPPGRHMPCERSLGVRLVRSWQTGPVMPRVPMWLSLGSGHVMATHPCIAMHATMAAARGNVH